MERLTAPAANADAVIGSASIADMRHARTRIRNNPMWPFHHARRSNAGFTLVEILIVVVILAILAAVVLPSFTNAGERAKASATLSQLRHVRDQIARYRFEHKDVWPDLVTHQWDPLIKKSDVEGNLGVDGAWLGPYLVNVPINPFNSSATVVAEIDVNAGWVYDVSTGQLDAIGFDEDRQLFTPPTP